MKEPMDASEIFERAQSMPTTDRDEFLDRACGSNRGLRELIESLLLVETRGALSPAQQPTPRAPSSVPSRLAHYSILEEIGRGGMGIVYRARDEVLGREVALKILPPEYEVDSEMVRRFEREARVAAALNHPGIVTVHSMAKDGERHFLVMEFVVGVGLDRLIPQRGFDLDRILQIGLSVSNAVAAAHRKRLVHRDLKPSNIMVATSGQVRVLDFGLAKAAKVESRPCRRHQLCASGVDVPSGIDAVDRSQITRSGAILGTIPYMAPELLCGEDASTRSDVFALGVVLYEMCSGHRPFQRTSLSESIAAILRDDPRSIASLRPDLPTELAEITNRCLQKDATIRYETAGDLWFELVDLTDGRGASDPMVHDPSLALRMPATPRRRDCPRRDYVHDFWQDRIEEWSSAQGAMGRGFVGPTLLAAQGSGRAPTLDVGPTRYRSLLELLESENITAAVLLGPPGAGKSTLLRHLEFSIAARGLQGNDERITFLVQLSQYRAHDAPTGADSAETWLHQCWQRSYPHMPPLTEMLSRRSIVFLLDGLNEMSMPSATDLRHAVRDWKAFVDRLASSYPNSRVVFSCRTLDYSMPLSTSQVPVRQVRVEPLTDEQIRRILTLRDDVDGEDLWDALSRSRQLESVRSPFFLSLLGQADPSSTLPPDPAGILTGFVRHALARETERDNPLFAFGRVLTERDVRKVTQWKWQDDWELPSDGVLVDRLESLASHLQAGIAIGEGSRVQMDIDRAVDALGADLGDDVLRAGLALGLVDEDSVANEIFFAHQLTQEYFAGRRLAADPAPELVAVPWMAEETTPSLEESISALQPGEALPDLAGTGWEEATLFAAEMASDASSFVTSLMGSRLDLAGRCAALPSVKTRLPESTIHDLQRALITRSSDPRADVRARVSAGLSLGTLGDPRFHQHRSDGTRYLTPPMVHISSGTYPIGEDVLEPRNKKANAHFPRQEIRLASFDIGKFPVTNAEYACFVQAGGYEDERWWTTPSARRWWTGEDTGIAAHRNVRRAWRRYRDEPRLFEGGVKRGVIVGDYYDLWKRRLAMTESELDAHLQSLYPGGKVRAPAFWDDPLYNNAAQPVVGVCWFEACAYVEWLSAISGVPFRLPTETEWEVAARGFDESVYAWGNDFESSRCNSAMTRLGRASPVGAFPGGSTPLGVSDMSGNVNEITSSRYEEALGASAFRRPLIGDDGRESLVGKPEDLRVQRGGSCYSDAGHLRASQRRAVAPGSRFYESGLRLASPPQL